MAMKPLEGDVSTIRSRAQRLTTAATAMGSAADQLETIRDYSGYSSGALRAVGEKVGDLREMVLRAKTRYAGAGAALSTYADELAEAQADANRAISSHNGLQGSLASAESRADDQKVHVWDIAATDQERADYRAAKQHLDDLREQESAAESKYRSAEDDRDRAARTAINAIEAANRSSDLDDSWWDNVGQWWSSLPWKEILATVKFVADVVALLTTVVGFVLLFTPLAPLGGALLAVGRIAALISLGVTAIQATRKEATWAEVGIGVLLLAVGGSGKLFRGIGQAAGKLGGLRNLLGGSAAAGLAGLARRVPGLLRSGAAGAGRNLGKTWDGLRVVRDYNRMAQTKSAYEYYRASDPGLWKDWYDGARRWTAMDGATQFGQNIVDNSLGKLASGEVSVSVPGAEVSVDGAGIEVRFGLW